MHRTQLILEDKHYRYLQLHARRNKMSLSAAVRSLVEKEMAAMKSAGDDPLVDIIGAFSSGHGDTARRAEEILYGRPRKS